MPCAEGHLVLQSESGGHLTTYYGEDMNTYYKMLKPIEYANDNFYMTWTHLDTSYVIKSWCREPTKFCDHPSAIYLTNILRDVYQFLIAMYYHLYGRKDAEVFEENHIYTLNIMVTHEINFNWEDIFPYALQYQVG